MTGELLRVENLSIEFGTHSRPARVVDSISFNIQAGRILGLAGESGSGKTVTSLAILRLIPEPPGRIVAGRIVFEGEDITALPLTRMPEIRGRDIAMIFQEPMSSLNPVMTIGEQIAEMVRLHEKLSAAARRNRVIDMLRRVGIPDPAQRLDAYPHQFSGGMRQRVMIAMALVCRPKLLIADEPTTALDVTIQAQVLELMKSLRTELNMAILLISHDLGVIAELCDQIVVMYAGRILEDGDVRSVFRNPSHPYTRGLLSSIPRLDEEADRLHQIAGVVPVAGSIRQGCPFYARCPLRIERCRSEMPPNFRFGVDHTAACWVTAHQQSARPIGTNP